MELKIIITALISLILLGVTVKNYRWGLYLFIFLCPIIPPTISLYINDTFPLITFQRIMLAILVLVWLVKYLAGYLPKAEKPPLILLLLVFIGLILISFLLTPQPKIVLKEFFSERVIGIVVIYFLVFQMVRDKETILRITYILLISTFIVAFMGVIEEIIQKNLFYELGKYLLPEDKLNRLGFDNFPAKRFGVFLVQSSFPISNGLAAHLVFMLPIALSILFFIKRKSWIILMLLAIVTSLACLIFTGALIKERGFHRFWQAVGVSQAVLQHPMGTGLKTFNETVKIPPIPGEPELRPADGYAYSQQVLVETGVLSFIVLVIIYLILLIKIKAASKQFQEHDDHFWSKFSWSLFTAFAINLILSLGTHSILNTNNGIIIFWISVALAMRLWQLSDRQGGHFPPRECVDLGGIGGRVF